MNQTVLDDHLLRDLLSGELSDGLAQVLVDHEPATTNLYLVRLCRSVVSATGGTLTGSWPSSARLALGRQLLDLHPDIEVVPVRNLAYRMAELADAHKLSTLGAEAVAASEHLSAPLCVWTGDDGPRIRSAMSHLGCDYRPIPR
ncbi:MAG: hypothetical protein F4Y27_13580 [Acidimicrobiaceae bacterium]|nr:hypothetical protein [Acidimicrobiaceae bacterium]MXW61801.1 hypothetical protein [Acidimicrobiaceae bacterium]MXW76318.1 hypothetical protein [Acidimicrobiaceae bacterium]MYA75693.1 hypothetical protein [Acidimicrobiaceae bacterium]MYC42960.1 hypothetical protein [Acidimicrobiaceae bacterium]